MTEINKEFGSRLKELIQNEGLKQKDFAEKLEIPVTTLNSYVTRGSVPPLDILGRIADYFGVTLDYLLRGRTPWDAKKIIDKREKSGLIIEGHRVAEDTELYKAVKRLMDVPEADIAKVRQVLDLIQSVAREKQKVKKPPPKAENEG